MSKSVGEQWADRLANYEAPYAPGRADRAFFENCLALPHTRLLVRAAGLRGTERVLEAGCGSGKFSAALALHGCRVTALDYSPRVVDSVGRLKQHAEALFGSLDLTAVRGNVEALELPDETYDLAFNAGVVEHWLDRAQRLAVLREMLRVTRRGGTVLVMVPHTGHLLHRWWSLTKYPGYNCPPMTRYTARTLRADLAAAGCVDVQCDGLEPYNSLSQWPNWWPLRKLTALCNRVLPQPRWLRRTFGVHLAAWGRKPRPAPEGANGPGAPRCEGSEAPNGEARP